MLIFYYGNDHGLQEEFEDTKGVKIRKSKKDRQHNDQKKKDKRTNNDLQNTTQKTKDRATWIQLKTGGELMCSISDTRRVNEKYWKYFMNSTDWLDIV